MLRSFARKALEPVLRSFGYELHEIGTHLRGFDNFVAFIQQRGFVPELVIDIGVGHGTPWLYKAFPKAKFVLFEALPVFEPTLREICSRLDAHYHVCALTDTDGEAAFYVPENAPTGSSLLPRSDRWKASLAGSANAAVRETKVPARRLDSFNLQGSRILIKIDVEGAELAVLRGAAETLKKTDVVICELRVQDRHGGQAEMADVLSFMAGQQFQLFDIVEMESQRDGPLAYIDVAFVRENSVLLAK